jgi:hypothetical protein
MKPDVNVAETGIWLPLLSRASVMSNTLRIEAMAMNTELSAKCRPGHILVPAINTLTLYTNVPEATPSTKPKGSVGIRHTKHEEAFGFEFVSFRAICRFVVKHLPVNCVRAPLTLGLQARYQAFPMMRAPSGMKYFPYMSSCVMRCAIPRGRTGCLPPS